MSKKDVSRRGFLKGIVQATGAAGMATMFKFFPEAKEVFSDGRSTLQYDVSPLPAQQTERLKQEALSDINCGILRDYLDKQGFEEVPNVYFAYRVDIRGKDENGKNFRTRMDHLIIGCSNRNNSKGAMLWFSVDRNSRNSQWQVPFVVIQDDAISYVKDEQVTIYDRESQLTSASWFSDIVNGNSPAESKSPLLDHGVCSRIVDTCYIAAGTCVAATVCCITTLFWCGPQVVVCGGTIVPCALASDCCNNNPGTHDC